MGVEQRVTQLEADVATLKDSMCSCHKTLDSIVKIHRAHGEYMEADLCDHCHELLETTSPAK